MLRAANRRAAWEWRRERSNDGHASLREHLRERDQRQADEGSRILGVDARDQRDAETFGLRAAGAVIGLLLSQIAFDRPVIELAEGHRAWHDTLLQRAAFRIQQRHRGVKLGALSAERAELSRSGHMVPGLIETL